MHSEANVGLHTHTDAEGHTVAHEHEGAFKPHPVCNDDSAAHRSAVSMSSSMRRKLIGFIGLACMALAVFGAGCMAHFEVGGAPACPAGDSIGVPLMIVGGATTFVLLIYMFFTREGTMSSEMPTLRSPGSEKTPLLDQDDGGRVAVGSGIQTALYTSQFLSSWGDRMWQFAVPMLFMDVFVDTLLPSALFGMVVYLGASLPPRPSRLRRPRALLAHPCWHIPAGASCLHTPAGTTRAYPLTRQCTRKAMHLCPPLQAAFSACRPWGSGWTTARACR
jgi:hypothetical protein